MAGSGDPVPSSKFIDYQENAKTADEFVNSAALATTSRTGKSVFTIEGIKQEALNRVGGTGLIWPSVPYESGLNVTSRAQTYSYDDGNGVVIYNWIGDLPFTTTGDFSSESGWNITQFRNEFYDSGEISGATINGNGGVVTLPEYDVTSSPWLVLKNGVVLSKGTASGYTQSSSTEITINTTLEPDDTIVIRGAAVTEGGGSGGSQDADEVPYDNTESGLSATNVQAAIDEVANVSFDSVPTSMVSVLSAQIDASRLNIAILGDSTECGIGESGASPYGEANGYNNDGWGTLFYYTCIQKDRRFVKPDKRNEYYKQGKFQSNIDCPFPCLQFIVSESPSTTILVVNNSNVGSTSFTIYHSVRTADTAARFRVRCVRTTDLVEVGNQIVDTYVDPVSYATDHDVQARIGKTTITLSGSGTQANSLYVVIEDLDVIDRGSGVAADGTALVLGFTYGNGIEYNNLAVSSTTLTEGSQANIDRGVDTSERIALADSLGCNAYFIGWGTNDSKVGVTTVNDFKAEYNSVIEAIRTNAGADVPIFLMTDPRGAEGSIYDNNPVYNQAIREVAAQNNCGIIDIEKVFDQVTPLAYNDDVHPSSFGYGMIAYAVNGAIGYTFDYEAINEVAVGQLGYAHYKGGFDSNGALVPTIQENVSNLFSYITGSFRLTFNESFFADIVTFSIYDSGSSTAYIVNPRPSLNDAERSDYRFSVFRDDGTGSIEEVTSAADLDGCVIEFFATEKESRRFQTPSI